MQPAAAGPLGDQRPLVFSHRPADLQQQLVVGVVGQWAVGEFHPAAVPLQLLQQEHLVDVVAGQPIWVGDQDKVEAGEGGLIA